MRFAIYLPTARDFADPPVLADLAAEAEERDRDGVFIWDELSLSLSNEPWPLTDPWVSLAAIATRTTRVRIGPMVTPLARRRPSRLARETVAIDHLSRGRVVLGVGLGAAADSECAAFGEDPDPKVRAQKVDDGLEIVDRLWRGEPVKLHRKTTSRARHDFLSRPVQQPRIPIWVGGWWPNRAPARRAARWDGMFPVHPGWPDSYLAPDDYRAIRASSGSSAAARRVSTSRRRGRGPATTRRSRGRPSREYEDVGVTWWLQKADSLESAGACIRESPLRA